MARWHGANYCAGPAAVFLQVVEGERQYLVRRQPGAAFVNNAEAVGVAVEADTDLGLAAANELAGLGHAFGVRFRMMPAEERIEFVVKTHDFCAGIFEQPVEISAPGAIHQFHCDPESGLSDS